jgi:SAM-dependent methyltransferase
MHTMSQEFNEICRQLESWYDTPLGAYLYAQERQIVGELVQPLFGHRLLQLGTSTRQPLLESAPQVQKIYAASTNATSVQLCTDLDHLPFAAESIDILVLHHAVEFAANPHQLLREANRVLAHRGEIIVVGFNPWSLFGAVCGLQRLFGRQPWTCAQSLSKHRLRDWLHLLGMEVENIRHSVSAPPWGKGRLKQQLLQLDAYTTRKNWMTGGLYIMHARKQVSSLTPDRARWNRRVGDRLIGLTSPKPVPSPFEGDVAA